MTVRELIDLLKKQPLDALVVTWADVHESSGPQNVTGLAPIFVVPGDLELEYSAEQKPGMVSAVEIN